MIRNQIVIFLAIIALAIWIVIRIRDRKSNGLNKNSNDDQAND
jgi:preprotein translocase subunit SecG